MTMGNLATRRLGNLTTRRPGNWQLGDSTIEQFVAIPMSLRGLRLGAAAFRLASKRSNICVQLRGKRFDARCEFGEAIIRQQGSLVGTPEPMPCFEQRSAA